MRRLAASVWLLLALAGRAHAGSAGCLVEWRVAGATAPRAICRDGDTCDADGIADGACTFAVRLCVNVAGCPAAAMPTVRVTGPDAAAVTDALASLGAPPVAADACTADVPVRVRRGRGQRLVARARDAATHRHDRDALALACRSPARPGSGRALVVTTDFETGILATVGVRKPHPVGHPASPIHSDAVVRIQGERAFVVNRFLGDNLQVLDPTRGFATVLQCSTGPGSNPHDVAVAGPHKAYVTRYDERELWIVDPDGPSCAGFRLGAIDLSPWADADGLPEMDQMALVGDRLFVTLERLDRTRGFAPSGRSRIAVIDTSTDVVTDAIDLTGSNAFGDASGLVREPGTGKLVVAEAGSLYHTGDGGLERVDPFTLVPEGFFITENDLGGSVTDFVLVSPTKGYAIVIDQQLRNTLVAFDPTARVVTGRLLTRTTSYLPDVALAPDGTLWVADDALPAPGIRIFDSTTDRQLTTSAAIDVGLPPFSMGFLP
jgi:DNA-binding beta-propeller fold protein YncE